MLSYEAAAARARVISTEIACLEHEIRMAERSYQRLVKKAAWSDDDCAEADGIKAYIAAVREEISALQAGC